MVIFKPAALYVKVFVGCALLAVVLFYFHRNFLTASLPFVVALVSILPALIINPRLELSDDLVLSYDLFRNHKTVDLQKLTNCNYRLRIGGKSLPCMVFHLYDSDGGAMTFPANDWSNSRKLYEAVSQAVVHNRLQINNRTAKKLRINSGI